MKKTIWVYCTSPQNADWAWAYHANNMDFGDDPPEGWSPGMELEIEFEPLSTKQAQALAVISLKAQLNKAREEYETRVAELNEQLQKYQAIE